MSTGIKIMLVWVSILGLGFGAISRAEGAIEEKLINPEDIIAGFEQGTEKVKVIVNLAKPQGIKSTMDWNSMQSLERLHNEIRNLQTPVLSMLSNSEFKLRHRFENLAGFSGEVTLDGLAKLMDDPRVESIEPVYILERLTGQGIPLMNASVPRQTYNGQGTAIAIIDDGIDYNHPKLGGGGFPNSKVIGGADLGEGDDDPFPIEAPQSKKNWMGQGYYHDYHGTCAAGIAAGDIGSTGDYIGGVAYGAKLYAWKVSESDGTIYNDTLTNALEWCVTHKNDNPSNPILVVSISLGSGRHYSPCDAIDTAGSRAVNDAVAAGITVLAGSGNDGYCDSIYYPACLANVISVGAVYDAAFGESFPCIAESSCATKHPAIDCPTGWYAIDDTAPDMVQSGSCTADFLDILAPGSQAYTTDISGSLGYALDDYVHDFSGTSASCPYAAGAVACLQSAAKARTDRYLSPSEVRDILTSKGDDITDGKVDITKPRINLCRAIDSLCDTITIGMGSSSWSYPMHTFYHDSRTQVIYLASEIGTSGTITALALDIIVPPEQTMNLWTIRMKHTSMSAYTTTSLDNTGWTVVYQNNEDIDNIGWRTFEFQTPFEYNGIDNLLVDFSHNNNFFEDNGMCKASIPGSQRSSYARSDSSYGDPLDWVGSTSPDVSYSDFVPNVELTICPPCTQCQVVFEDTFTFITIDQSNWLVVDGATIDDVGMNEPSPPYSLRLNGDDSVESDTIDLSSCSSATLTYHFQRTGGGESPDDGDDLIIEYSDGFIWVELDRQPGAGSDMIDYNECTVSLPPDAMHANFRVGIRSDGYPGFDDWFVDDMKIEACQPDGGGNVIVNPSFESDIGWQMYNSWPFVIVQRACLYDVNFADIWEPDGSCAGVVGFNDDYFYSANDYGYFRQTVDWTGVDTLVFDFGGFVASGTFKVTVFIDGAPLKGEEWPVPLMLTTDSLVDKRNVRIDVSSISGREELELRVDVEDSGSFLAMIFWDNFRTYGL